MVMGLKMDSTGHRWTVLDRKMEARVGIEKPVTSLVTYRLLVAALLSYPQCYPSHLSQSGDLRTKFNTMRQPIPRAIPYRISCPASDLV